VAELFPGSTAPTEFAAGVEKLISIDTAGGGSKRGFVDAYGNAIIEFENSLKATFVCVLSDGINWKTYRPTAKATKGKLIPEDVEFQELRVLSSPISGCGLRAFFSARQERNRLLSDSA
jgi:hypothetical protein